MKLKSTLVVMALGAGFGAMAHHTSFNTPFNAHEAINRPMAGHANVALNNGTAAEMDETPGATINGDADFYFRYDGDKKIWGGFQTPSGVSLQQAMLYICVGPKVEGSEKTTITPRLKVTSKKDANGQNAQLPMEFAFEPIELTDEVQHLCIVSEEKSGEWFTNGFVDAVTGKELKARYYDLYFDDADAGQFVAWEGMGFARNQVPVLNFTHEATWTACMTAQATNWPASASSKYRS